MYFTRAPRAHRAGALRLPWPRAPRRRRTPSPAHPVRSKLAERLLGRLLVQPLQGEPDMHDRVVPDLRCRARTRSRPPSPPRRSRPWPSWCRPSPRYPAPRQVRLGTSCSVPGSPWNLCSDDELTEGDAGVARRHLGDGAGPGSPGRSSRSTHSSSEQDVEEHAAGQGHGVDHGLVPQDERHVGHQIGDGEMETGGDDRRRRSGDARRPRRRASTGIGSAMIAEPVVSMVKPYARPRPRSPAAGQPSKRIAASASYAIRWQVPASEDIASNSRPMLEVGSEFSPVSSWRRQHGAFRSVHAATLGSRLSQSSPAAAGGTGPSGTDCVRRRRRPAAGRSEDGRPAGSCGSPRS